MNNNIFRELINITNDEKIKDDLNFYAIYLLLFENFKNTIITNLKNFLCDFSIKDGKVLYVESPEYKKLTNKRYNKKKNLFLNSLAWFKETNVITKQEFDKIIEIRNDRNKIGHELFELLLCNVDEKMIKNFIELIRIFKKIDNWWINNIEIPIAGDEISPGYDEDGVKSGNYLLCEMLIDTIYGNKTYEELIQKIFSKKE